jgi:hypothetical protein
MHDIASVDHHGVDEKAGTATRQSLLGRLASLSDA